MDVKSLVRDASDVGKVVKVVDNKLVACRSLQIHIPFRYIPAKMATLGKYNTCVAIFPIVYGDRYMVSNVCSSLQLTPSTVMSETIDDEEYYIFGFNAGEIISPRLDMVVTDDDVYNTYNELIGKAKIPWFLTYEDIGKCIANAHYFGGITLSGTNAVIELLVASIARSRKDLNTYYRNEITRIEEQLSNPPYIFPFRSIIAGTTNTVGKLIGSYFDEGMTSALTHEGGPPGVEDLFRL